MKSLSTEQRFSQTIEMMRFPLILLVVIAHMVPFDSPAVRLSTDIDAIYVFVSEMMSHNLARVAVPCYFLISGYFFFKSSQKWDWNLLQTKLKKKVRTLLIPYVVWNALLIFAIVVKSSTFDWLGFGKDEGFVLLKSTSLYDWFWCMPINFPLWYMRDLLVMVFISPLFYLLFKYTKVYGLLVLVGIYLCVLETNLPGFSTTAVFFFGTGAYLALNKKDMISLFERYRTVMGILAGAVLLVATLNNGTSSHEYIVRIFIIFAVISTVNLFDHLRKFDSLKNVLFAFAPTTFFVYVVHEIYIIAWLKGALARVAQEGWLKLIGYFLVPWICVGICIGLFYLLRRMVPTLMQLALGGRVDSDRKRKKI